MKFFHGILGGLSGNNFDLANYVAILVNNFTFLIDLLSGTIGNLAFRQLANRLTIFVEDLSLLVDLQSFQDRKIWFNIRHSVWQCVPSLFKQFWVKRLHRLVGGFTWNDLDLADDVAICIKDLAVLIGDFACAFLEVGVLGELANGLTLFV